MRTGAYSGLIVLGLGLVYITIRLLIQGAF